jgi:hypothetical protein
MRFVIWRSCTRLVVGVEDAVCSDENVVQRLYVGNCFPSNGEVRERVVVDDGLDVRVHVPEDFQ